MKKIPLKVRGSSYYIYELAGWGVRMGNNNKIVFFIGT